MTSKERREGRYQRRKAKRLANRIARCEAIGGIEQAMSFHELYKAGKKSCNGVRWKNSVQRFELHLFSGTAKRAKEVQDGTWKPAPYVHFMLCERGKIRPIDAPRVQDRQVHKAFTKNVLLPLYLPSMIYNNGASLEGKGYHFSMKVLADELREHFRKYGREGSIILTDYSQFFPTASHKTIYDRHKKLILDYRLRNFGDKIVASVKGDVGMPLGVEPSQAEMVALPSDIDNYLKCQRSLDGAGHYMDDYAILVPPDLDPKEILNEFIQRSTERGFTISRSKSRIAPLTKPFRYCKAKYALTETGKVVISGNRTSPKRTRRKIRAFHPKFESGEMSGDALWTSVNGSLAYLENYNDFKKKIKLRRLFFALYGFSSEKIEYFRQRSKT